MQENYLSPDGRFNLSLGCNEFRMSHWVCSPELIDTLENETLFRAGSFWDAGNIQWSSDSREIRFFMRKYPGSDRSKNCWVTIRIKEKKVLVQYEGHPDTVISLDEANINFKD